MAARFVAAALISCIVAQAPALAQEAQFPIDLPAQPLSKSLFNASSVTGLQLIFTEPQITRLKARALSGKFTARQMFDQLLDHSGYRFEIQGDVVRVFSAAPGARLTKTTLMSAAAAPAMAQAETAPQADEGTSSGLQDIVVTAQRRAENAQDVPIAISTVSNEQLQAAGVVSAADLGNVVSGFNVGTTAGYFQPRVRGVGTSFFGAAVENPVALYIDDVYYNSQLMAPSDLSDLEQVTVLKGPQGTLFGRNSTGGVVQMRTRGPSDTFQAEISTELDQYLTSRSYAFVAGPITDTLRGSLFGRFATQGEGWGKNLVTNEEIYKIDHDWALRGKLEWDAGDRTTIKLSADYAHRKDTNGQNLRLAIDQPEGATGFFPGLGTTIESDNPHDVASTFSTRVRFKGGGVSLGIEQELGFADLTSITAYRELKYFTFTDTDNSPTVLFNTGVTQWSRQFTQEIRLQSKPDSDAKWLLGGFYYKTKDSINLNLDFYDASADSLNTVVDTETFGFPFPLSQFGNFPGLFCGYLCADTRSQSLYFNTLRSESIAAFGEVTVPIMETTRITAGLRFTHDYRAIDGNVQTFLNSDPEPVSIGIASPTFKKDQLTWRLSIDHDFADHFMGYASYNRGYKSGGFNGNDDPSRVPGPSANFPYKPYQPEKVDAFEVGIKADLFDRRLRLNPAVFYSKYSNIQVGVVDLTTVVSSNAPGLKLYGVDLDGQWQATNNLNFTFGVEWLKTEFDDFPNAPLSILIPGGGVQSTTFNARGNELPYAPEWAFNVGVNYTAQIAGSKVDFNVIDAYNDGYYFEVDNVLRQKAFHMLNASVTWHSPNDVLSVSLWGRNIFDEVVAQQGAATFPVGYTASYNTPPATFGFTAKMKFGS